MTKDVRKYIRGCAVYQKYKYEGIATSDLLQPSPLSKSIFTDLTMDFIEGLPKSNSKSVIMVVVDRLTKYSHFMALPHPYSAASVARVFFDNVHKLYGFPNTITTDRGSLFLSTFWKELFALQGIGLQYSTAYHPQNKWANRGG